MSMYVISGPQGSGKSIKAENYIASIDDGENKAYIATMVPYGEEGAARVARHRAQREGKGYITYEQPRNLYELVPTLKSRGHRTALLECASNLIGNEMYYEGNKNLSDEELVSLVIDEVKAIEACVDTLVVVSNDFDDSVDYDEETRRYVRLCREVALLL